MDPSVEKFSELAEQYSIEANSRALRGEVPPIQRYGGQPQLEAEAFTLQTGELSSIVQTGATFVILYCEGRTEPQKIDYKEVKDEIYQDLHEKKMRIAMAKKFEDIRDKAQVDNFLAGTVQAGKHGPGGAFQDPSVKPASGQSHHGGKGRGGSRPRNPDMSTEDLIKDGEGP